MYQAVVHHQHQAVVIQQPQLENVELHLHLVALGVGVVGVMYQAVLPHQPQAAVIQQHQLENVD